MSEIFDDRLSPLPCILGSCTKYYNNELTSCKVDIPGHTTRAAERSTLACSSSTGLRSSQCVPFRLQSAKDKRSASIASSFRSLFATPRQGETAETISREARNLVVFLQAQREYDVSRTTIKIESPIYILPLIQELLKRYNPLHDLSPEDHRLATAHRVGLNMPKDFSGQE